MKDKNMVALTPPMGWNNWDCYGASVNEETLLANARYMAEHLKPFGWEYVVCDIEWSEPTAASTEYHPFAALEMDEYSRLLPAKNRFPSGFRAIADQIHAMGLKFGIHIMRGIPRQAVHSNTAILGSENGARHAARANAHCRWNTEMYGLDPSKPEAALYYDSLFALYAEWGVDYVKVDDICRVDYQPGNSYASDWEVALIRAAIDKSGRDMVLSLSPGPANVERAWHLSQNANLWRITDDLWDEWPLVKAMFERCEVWQTHVQPGCWPDCDMLPLGTLRMWTGGEKSRLTPDEQITLMTLWCLFRSPLMMGGELRENDEFTLKLLTNEGLLRMHRTGKDARQLFRDDKLAVWRSEGEGCSYLALFNLSDEEIQADWPVEGAAFELLTGAPAAVCGAIRPHASRAFRITK